MKRSIRLDQKLLSDAEAAGGKFKRSMAAQVEYWATVGRHVVESNEPSKADREAFKKFNRVLMQQVQSGVDSGQYKEGLFKKGYVFEASKQGPGYVDKVSPDGSRVTGQVVKGEFVEYQAKARSASR